MDYTLEEMFTMIDFEPFIDPLRRTLNGEKVFLMGNVVGDFSTLVKDTLGKEAESAFWNNIDLLYTHFGMICESRFLEMELRNKAKIKSGAQRNYNLREAYQIKLEGNSPEEYRDFSLNKMRETLDRYEAYKASLSLSQIE